VAKAIAPAQLDMETSGEYAARLKLWRLEQNRIRNRKWYAGNGKKTKESYAQSKEGKAARLRAVNKYNLTEKGHVAYEKAQRNFYQKLKENPESEIAQNRRATARIRNNRRYTGDLQFKIAAILRTNLNKRLRRFKVGVKSGSAVRDLGCSLKEALVYWQSLETWSPEWTWVDHGTLFEMDHVRPLASFDLGDREQFLQAAHHTNLQPLSIGAHREKTKKDILSIKEDV